MRPASRPLAGLLLCAVLLLCATPPARAASEAEARCEQQSGTDAIALANCLAREGEQLGRSDRQDEALLLFQRTLALREARLGPAHPDVGVSLTAIAITLAKQRRYTEALPAIERGVAILQAAPTTSGGRLVLALTSQGAILRYLGRYPEALAAFEQAVATGETRLGPEHPALVAPLRLLASLQRELGQRERVLPLYERALRILDQQARPDPAELAIVLRNLGLTHRRAGQPALGLPYIERGLALQAQRLGPAHPSLLNTVVDLGMTYLQLGRRADAQAMQQRAADAVAPLLAAGRSDLGDLVHDLALLAGRLGDHALALSLTQRALAAAGSDDPELLWRLQDGLLQAAQRAGQRDEAILWGKQAVNVLQGLRGNLAPLGRESSDTFIDAPKRGAYLRLADLLVAAGRLLEAQQVLQMLKEEELQESGVRGAGAPGMQVELSGLERARFARYYELREQQLALYRERRALEEQRRRAPPLAPDAQRRLDEITQRLVPQLVDATQRFYATLQQQLDAARAPGGERRDVRLAETLLRRAVVGAAQQRPEARPVGLQYLLTEDRLSIILTVPDGPALARQVEIDAGALRRLIASLSLQLKTPASDPALLRANAQKLHTLLIAPILPDLRAAQARTLMLSLTDVLRYVPFAALHDGQRWLVQDYALALFNEAGGQSLGAAPAGRWRVAGMGLSQAVDGLRALPAVPEELDAVVGIVGGTPYLDARFTRPVLLDALAADFNVLHLASHFVFQLGDPGASRLYLGDKSRLTLADIGALDLRFDRFDLVTLSACETAQAEGRDAYGQELESLGAKAQAQGARAVIATLWKVADRSTGRLMQRFYRLKASEAQDKAEALRRAQLALLEGELRPDASGGWSHPYYWAPFVLMGDWR